MIAPACPIVLPAGAVSPAIKPITGLFDFDIEYHFAASFSSLPPISPIKTIISVSLSSINNLRASFTVVPIIGSPPIPSAVEIPSPSLTT